MNQLLTTHPNSLFLFVVISIVTMQIDSVGTPLTSHDTSAKYFCDSMRLTQSVNFPSQISPNGKSPLLDLVMTNFPANVSCSSSAPIGSSDQVLVRVNISLAILRELPQHQRVWQFAQAD